MTHSLENLRVSERSFNRLHRLDLLLQMLRHVLAVAQLVVQLVWEIARPHAMDAHLCALVVQEHVLVSVKTHALMNVVTVVYLHVATHVLQLVKISVVQDALVIVLELAQFIAPDHVRPLVLAC